MKTSMKKPKIALIIGNGFSMSYSYYANLGEQWDTQKPLSWKIPCPTTQQPFLSSLPRLTKVIEEASEELSDFEIFKKTLSYPDFTTTLEARHYLTIAFSNYALLQASSLDGHSDWSWYRWLKEHKSNIIGALSLNYDLLLENILKKEGVEFFSFQENHHGYGIPLVKPHGSVDFDISSQAISYTPTYPLRNFVDLNNTPITRLESKDLLFPRRQALCIVPNEANKYADYQWVKPANEVLKNTLKECTHCLFIGISYFECDRPEIDSIIDSLPDSTQVIIANPSPPIEMVNKVVKRPLLLWKSYKGPVDNNNAVLKLKSASGAMLSSCLCRSGLSYIHCHGKNY